MPPQAGDIFLNRCSLASSVKKTENYSQPKPKDSPCQTPWRDRLLRSRDKTSKPKRLSHHTTRRKDHRSQDATPRRQLTAFRRRSCSVVLTCQIIKSVQA